MFNFGILSTSLPYLVLGITSLLYFASFSLNQMQNRSEKELVSEAKVIQHTEQIAKPDKTFFYQHKKPDEKGQIQLLLVHSIKEVKNIRFEFLSDPPRLINPEWLECHISLPPPSAC